MKKKNLIPFSETAVTKKAIRWQEYVFLLAWSAQYIDRVPAFNRQEYLELVYISPVLDSYANEVLSQVEFKGWHKVDLVHFFTNTFREMYLWCAANQQQAKLIIQHNQFLFSKAAEIKRILDKKAKRELPSPWTEIVRTDNPSNVIQHIAYWSAVTSGLAYATYFNMAFANHIQNVRWCENTITSSYTFTPICIKLVGPIKQTIKGIHHKFPELPFSSPEEVARKSLLILAAQGVAIHNPSHAYFHKALNLVVTFTLEALQIKYALPFSSSDVVSLFQEAMTIKPPTFAKKVIDYAPLGQSAVFLNYTLFAVKHFSHVYNQSISSWGLLKGHGINGMLSHIGLFLSIWLLQSLLVAAVTKASFWHLLRLSRTRNMLMLNLAICFILCGTQNIDLEYNKQYFSLSPLLYRYIFIIYAVIFLAMSVTQIKDNLVHFLIRLLPQLKSVFDNQQPTARLQLDLVSLLSSFSLPPPCQKPRWVPERYTPFIPKFSYKRIEKKIDRSDLNPKKQAMTQNNAEKPMQDRIVGYIRLNEIYLVRASIESLMDKDDPLLSKKYETAVANAEDRGFIRTVKVLEPSEIVLLKKHGISDATHKVCLRGSNGVGDLRVVLVAKHDDASTLLEPTAVIDHEYTIKNKLTKHSMMIPKNH